MQQRRVNFHTLGCKLNFSESSTLAREFEEGGFVRVAPDAEADICVVNSCSVTEHADKKCRNLIRKLHRRNPGAIIAVTGCYAQLKPQEIAAIEGVDIVLGNNDKGDLYKRVLELPGKGRAQVYSCDADSLTSFFAAFSRIAAAGQKEIVLTGVNTGDFGRTTGEKFIDLLRALDGVDGIERYRISSIEPNLLTDEIIAFCATSPKFQHHFHIPLQSGSDKILGLMRRRYTTARFADRIAAVRALMPDAFIGIDVIVGFPGETEEDFRTTYDFLAGLEPAFLHIFPFSERPGTPAVEMPGKVQASVATRRAAQLEALCAKLHAAFCARAVGSEDSVLFESTRRGGMMFGFTGNYRRVKAPYDKARVNTVCRVRLGAMDESHDLMGEIRD